MAEGEESGWERKRGAKYGGQKVELEDRARAFVGELKDS